MDKVWLSSTYYLDEAVQRLSANAERMLTRSLAFCANAESSGYVSEKSITMLGLPNPKKLVAELVDANIFIPRDVGGGWDFRSWEVWNSSGDKLIARKKSDRERQARFREKGRVSREMSRDVTPTEKRREEKNSGYVGKPTHQSNARTRNGAELARQDFSNMPVTSVDGLRMARAYSESLPTPLDPKAIGEVAEQATYCLNSGYSTEQVAAGIRDWQASDSWAASQIRHFVAKVSRGKPRNGVGKPTEKALGIRAAGDEIIAEMSENFSPSKPNETEKK